MSSAILSVPCSCNNTITRFWERNRETGITSLQPMVCQVSDYYSDIKQGASKALRKRTLLYHSSERNIYRKKKKILSVPPCAKQVPKKVWVRPCTRIKETSYQQVSSPATRLTKKKWSQSSWTIVFWCSKCRNGIFLKKCYKLTVLLKIQS